MSLLAQFVYTPVKAAFDDNSPVGTVVAGKVTEVEVRQATEYVKGGKTIGALLFHPDGKPKEQYVVTVQADGVPITKDDDGLRRMYIKMWYKTDRQRLVAAVESAGDDDVQVGGHFAVRYDGYGTDEKGQQAAWKEYTYEYRKPTASNGSLIGDKPAEPAPTSAPAVGSAPALFSTPHALNAVLPAPSAPVAAVQPPAPVNVPAPPAPVVQALMTPTELIAYMAAGWSDAQLSTLDNAPPAEALAAVRNLGISQGALTA